MNHQDNPDAGVYKIITDGKRDNTLIFGDGQIYDFESLELIIVAKQKKIWMIRGMAETNKDWAGSAVLKKPPLLIELVYNKRIPGFILDYSLINYGVHIDDLWDVLLTITDDDISCRTKQVLGYKFDEKLGERVPSDFKEVNWIE